MIVCHNSLYQELIIPLSRIVMMTNKNGKHREYSLVEKAKRELGSGYRKLDEEVRRELESIDKLRKLSEKYSLSPSDFVPA